jgi:hypothetical protein
MSQTPPAIRILPMNRHTEPEFKKYQDVKEFQEGFFLRDLPGRPDGEYWYREGGLRAEPRTVVLFQSDGAIIATAILKETKKFDKPKNDGGTLYTGALYFDVKSIRVFEPIEWNIIRHIWPEVKRAARVKWNLNPSGYVEFEAKLTNIRGLQQPARAPKPNDLPDTLPATVERTYQRIVRDSEMCREIKNLYGYRCQVCGLRLELKPGDFYAETHHIRHLGGGHKGLDVRDNILCLCPNHHVLFDNFAMPLDPTRLRLKKHDLRQSFVDYHNAHVAKGTHPSR